MELKLGETTKLKWMEHSNDSTKTPPYADLLRFMDLQAQHFESALFELKTQTTAYRFYTVVEEACVACGKGNHPLGNCPKFQSATHEEGWDLVTSNVRCKNCLKQGHIASKCRAAPCAGSVTNNIIHCSTRRPTPNWKKVRDPIVRTQHLQAKATRCC